MEERKRLLVLDFDGTVCLGDAPIRAFAGRVAERLSDDRNPQTAVWGPLDRFLASTDREAWLASGDPEAATFAGAVDGYAAVDTIAAINGLDESATTECYFASREVLAGGDLTTYAPPGLHGFLDSLPDSTVCVLVTNAPLAGIEPQLAHLGIADRISRVITGAGKPAGMNGILTGLLHEYGLEDVPERLLSIGDIWVNDLEPAAELGCVTAHIDPHGTRSGLPTTRVQRFEDLYPFIEQWSKNLLPNEKRVSA